jgi:hypothetical protein
MAKNLNRARALIGFGTLAAGLSMASIGTAQTTQAAPAQNPAASTAAPLPSPLDALAWLRGCWTGSVNRREFIEQWSPPRGGMMVGFSHTVIGPKFQGSLREKMEAVGKTTEPGKDKTQDFEYLRLEARDDGIYYIAVPSGKKEIAFRLGSVGEESGATVFTFNNTVDEFPQRLIYRRGSEGWLYAQVAGKPGTAGGDVVYPMRHVDCATDAVLKE